MSEHIESVKAVAAYLRRVAENNPNNADVVDRVTLHANSLDDAVSHFLELERLTSALPPDLGNILDLPQELRDELSVAKTDDLEDQIITVINAYGGEASLDQILIGLFRKFEVVQKRKFLMNKLYRMQMVWSVEGRKGVYSTTEPEDEPDIQPSKFFKPERDLDSEIPF